jgi:hypothetical protein
MMQIEDLQVQDIQKINNHQLRVHGQLFQLGPRISKNLEKAAFEYCQICCKTGQACLLLEEGSYWVVWKRVSQSQPSVSVGRLRLPQKPLPPTSELSANFIDQCKRELVNCIGPIADVILENTLSALGTSPISPQDFICALSERIPYPELASAFHEHCQTATNKEVMASRIRYMKLSSSAASRYAFNQSRGVHSPVSI